MLAYYISQSNEYTFRTQNTASSEFTMSLQDMYTLQNFTMSMSGITYEGYESYISFTGSISGTIDSGEYRATLYNQTTTEAVLDIWHGTIQVYKSQSVDKADYKNQIPPVISHESENRYIILN
jgi:hypothetical protein